MWPARVVSAWRPSRCATPLSERRFWFWFWSLQGMAPFRTLTAGVARARHCPAKPCKSGCSRRLNAGVGVKRGERINKPRFPAGAGRESPIRRLGVDAMVAARGARKFISLRRGEASVPASRVIRDCKRCGVKNSASAGDVWCPGEPVRAAKARRSTVPCRHAMSAVLGLAV